VPGIDAGTAGPVAVTLSGATVGPEALDLVWGPEDVVAAWRA
jgi:hypothetical protein